MKKSLVFTTALMICMVFFLLMVPMTAIAQTNDTDDPAAFGLEDTSRLLAQVVSTIFWVVLGVLLIILFLILIDKITDLSKNNWFDLAALSESANAQAIFAAGLMVAIAVIIHSAISG